jgi:hypothetical protein
MVLKMWWLLPLVVLISGCGYIDSMEINEFQYGCVSFDHTFYPEVRPAIDKAMEDGKITWGELREIEASKSPRPTNKERLLKRL